MEISLMTNSRALQLAARARDCQERVISAAINGTQVGQLERDYVDLYDVLLSIRTGVPHESLDIIRTVCGR